MFSFSTLFHTRIQPWLHRARRTPWIRMVMVFSLGLGLGLILAGNHVMAQDQPAQPTDGSIPNPQQFRALEQSDSQLSFQRAEDLRVQANNALQSQNYEQAITALSAAFEAYNQRSNYHQQLSGSFAGIQNRIADEQREFARQAAQLRDEVTYELAIVYRAANRNEEAVGQLVQVISSQTPTRDLGRRAYQQLFELGFVAEPFE